MIQGGDIIHNNGSSGESIYGDTFEDENLDLTHEKEGIVGMCNSGPNTNQSQFYITTQPCPHLDRTNVVVGRVVKGFNTIVEMADVPRENDAPLELIEVENCGEFKPGEPWNIEENDGTDDKYPPWPNDWEIEVDKSHNEIEKALNAIKNSGNYYFNKNDYYYSERKYIKCLRYIDWYLGHTNNKKLQEMRISLTLNLAAAKLKRQKYKDAVNLCTEVIDKNPENGKAYYRRAQARLAMKDYDDSLRDLNRALTLYPNDTNIISVLNETKKYKLNYLKKERNLFSKMLNVGENGK
ncbi:unnamed protein product [Callosobruchus maculatus]|uniref:Peptidyl-prolyl cis-trans isomerase n=1 Tax=Callosobruchus maculatus TaxID=64391 RepID=A0A653DV43_CALMS|nr:unnamed protein product [Callosobruchus maculatus]